MKLGKQLVVILMTLVLVLSVGHTSEAASMQKQSTVNLQKQINALKKENGALKKNLATSKKENGTLKKNLATSKQEVSNLTKKVKNVEDNNKTLKAKVEEYKKYESGIKTESGIVKNIRVIENQASFYLDGHRLLPTVSGGKTPKTFMFDNQLYAPIEAVGQALLGGQKSTTWNASQQALYFGVAPQGKTVPISDLKVDEEYYMEVFGPNNNNGHSFEVLGTVYYPTNGLYGGSTSFVQYKLDGNYQSLKGTLALPQESIYDIKKSKLLFYSLDSYGKSKLIASYDIKNGDSFMNVSVDLSGVQYLKIQIDHDDSIFHNITLESLL